MHVVLNSIPSTRRREGPPGSERESHKCLRDRSKGFFGTSEVEGK